MSKKSYFEPHALNSMPVLPNPLPVRASRGVGEGRFFPATVLNSTAVGPGRGAFKIGLLSSALPSPLLLCLCGRSGRRPPPAEWWLYHAPRPAPNDSCARGGCSPQSISGLHPLPQTGIELYLVCNKKVGKTTLWKRIHSISRPLTNRRWRAP